MWLGDQYHNFALSLLTLVHQLQGEYPGQEWQNSPQTGTKGDEAHQAEGSASDHNYWLNNTVRALDVAANVSGVPGIVDVHDAPDCEYLFNLVNKMYAARDPRVYPDGYAIYKGRITDWDNPGGYHAQVGDQHLYHLHISVSTNPAGYNSLELWDLSEVPSSINVRPVAPPTETDEDMIASFVIATDPKTNEKKGYVVTQGGITQGDPHSVAQAAKLVQGAVVQFVDMAVAVEGGPLLTKALNAIVDTSK